MGAGLFADGSTEILPRRVEKCSVMLCRDAARLTTKVELRSISSHKTRCITAHLTEHLCCIRAPMPWHGRTAAARTGVHVAPKINKLKGDDVTVAPYKQMIFNMTN